MMKEPLIKDTKTRMKFVSIGCALFVALAIIGLVGIFFSEKDMKLTDFIFPISMIGFAMVWYFLRVQVITQIENDKSV